MDKGSARGIISCASRAQRAHWQYLSLFKGKIMLPCILLRKRREGSQGEPLSSQRHNARTQVLSLSRLLIFSYSTCLHYANKNNNIRDAIIITTTTAAAVHRFFGPPSSIYLWRISTPAFALLFLHPCLDTDAAGRSHFGQSMARVGAHFVFRKQKGVKKTHGSDIKFHGGNFYLIFRLCG
jgi:hypothetical protein